MDEKKDKLTIGRSDKIDLPDLHIFNIPAKIDTGAYTSSIHCANIQCVEEDGVKLIYFNVLGEGEKRFCTPEFKEKIIKNSFGHREKRFIIKTRVIIFNRIIRAQFSLSDRREMRYPILLGRKLLKGKFIVDASAENLSFNNKIQKNKK